LRDRLFSNEGVNRGRQVELDIARGLAVLFMVLVHVQIVFSTPELNDSFVGEFINFLGTPPAAPVFMFLLGAFIIYSSKNDPKTLIRRGLLLILAGYLLNLCRGTLPTMTQWAFLGGDQYLTIAWKVLIEIDILQFAGLAFIFFGLVRRYGLKSSTILALGIVLSLGGYFLSSLQTDDLLTSAVTGLFWGSSNVSYFPFVSWILMPVAGYVFGQYLVRCKDKERFYRYSLVISSLAVALSVLVLIIGLGVDMGLTNDYVYYHQDILANVIYISFAAFWLCVLFYVTKVLPKPVGKTIGRWSRNVTDIYIIHWILIGWIAIAIGRHGLDLFYYGLLSIAIFVVSDVLAIWYNKRKRLKAQEAAVKPAAT
jgi:uncharacterized membrane protein